MQRLLPVIRRFGLPVAAVLLAFLATAWVGAWSERGAFALFLGAVAVAAYFRGVEAGLAALAMTAALLAGHYLFVGQAAHWTDFVVSWLLFTILGALACYLCHGCRLGSRLTGHIEQCIGGMEDAVLLLNARGQITYLNPAAERLTGWPKTSALLAPVARVFQPLAEGDHRPLPASATKSVPPTSAVLVAREGTEHAIEYWAEPFGLDDDVAPGLLIVIRDIRDRKRHERTLSETAARFHALAVRTPAGLLVFDQEGQCVQANSAAEIAGGFAAYEAFGHGWLLFVHPDDRHVAEEWSSAVAKRAAFDKQFRLGHDNDVRWVRLRAEPVEDGNGTALGFVGFLEDVTRYRQMETELAKRGANDNRLNEIQQQLAASRKEVSELQREYERLEATRDQAEQQLRQQLAEAAKRHKETQEQLAERRRAEESLRQELDELTKRGTLSEEQRRELDALKSTNARLQQQLTERAQADEALAHERDQHRQTGQQLEELRRQLAEVSRVRSQLEQELAEQRRAGEQLLEEQTKLQAEREQQQAELQRQWDEARQRYEEERAQYAKQLEAGGRTAFLAEAGRLLAGSLDEHVLQQRLLALAVPTLGDCCVLHECLKDGALRRVEQHSVGDACATSTPLLPATEQLQSILSDGKSRLLNPLPEECLLHLAPAHDLPAQLEREPLCALCVPLIHSGERLGILSLVHKASESAYAPEIVQTAEDLAQLAAQALAQARVHRELQVAHEALERQLAALVDELEDARTLSRREASPNEMKEPRGELLFRVAQFLRAALRRIWEMLHVPAERFHELQPALEQEVRRLALSIDGVWCVVQLARESLSIQKQRVELNEVVRRGVATAQCFLQPRGHQVQLDLPATAAWLAVDPACVEQILVHLLDNAAKHTDAGGHICLAVEAHAGEVALHVRDDGAGIAAEQLPQLFDLNEAMRRFQKNGETLGIGLPLVHRLVELHGGKLEVSGAGSGCGSEVIVRLPLDDVPKKIRIDSAHAPAAPRQVPTPVAANL